MNKPKVSMGMPVYNGADCIADALESALAQTFGDWELVISDNASTDATEEVCRRYAARDSRIRYWRNAENLGASRNFNRVFELSTAPYFKWLTHDDVIAPSYLERCVRLLDEHASPVMCFPRRNYITHDGHPFYPGPDSYYYRLDDPAISYDRMSFARIVRLHGGLFPMLVFGLMRAEALRKTRLLGAFWAADLVLVAEMRLVGEIWEIPDVLYTQRLHPPNRLWLSRQKKRGEQAWFDPKGRSRLHPEIRLFVEYLRGIRHADMSWPRKMPKYLAMLGQAQKAVGRVSAQACRKVWAKISRRRAFEVEAPSGGEAASAGQPAKAGAPKSDQLVEV